MLKRIAIAMASIALCPMISFADSAPNYSPQEVELIENALDHLVLPARIDRVEVGVGIGDGDDNIPGRTRYVCYARSQWGQVFDAVGFSAARTQRRALASCYNYSRNCRAAGCRSVR